MSRRRRRCGRSRGWVASGDELNAGGTRRSSGYADGGCVARMKCGEAPVIINIAPMAYLQDQHGHTLILDCTHQPVITDSVSPRALDRKEGFSKAARVFFRCQILCDVFCDIPLRCHSELRELLLGCRIKYDPPLQTPYFFLISSNGMGVPGLFRTASTSGRSS